MSSDQHNEALLKLSLAEVSQLLRDGMCSPMDVLSTCLRRIDEMNASVNAFITVLRAEAGDQAIALNEELRAGKWRGPLHGVPVGVKDFYDTAGIRTTAAFEQFRNRIPANDAILVSKLKSAGAIIVGKTNMHTLGMGTTGLESCFGPALNPWNQAHIPGGSSSGSASAVAMGMCFATVDTDAIGSCRLPAACCGVVGFKGTAGLLETEGILAGEQDPGDMIRWFNQPGIMARSIGDLMLVLNVLAGPAAGGCTPKDFIQLSEEVRIGIVRNAACDAEVSAAFETAVEVFRNRGYRTKDVTAPLPISFDDLSSIESDRKNVERIAFRDVDILVLPTTATVTPKVSEAIGNPQALSAANTAFAIYYGLPAVSVPAGLDKAGVPLGLQIVGKPWEDAVVLDLARVFQDVYGERWRGAGPAH